ncbi:MAG: hypothetical protein HY929_04870 [Euryarchaeota archaeon]|nr:hypothetical protein [Euryarchaeota archaeon]
MKEEISEVDILEAERSFFKHAPDPELVYREFIFSTIAEKPRSYEELKERTKSLEYYSNCNIEEKLNECLDFLQKQGRIQNTNNLFYLTEAARNLEEERKSWIKLNQQYEETPPIIKMVIRALSHICEE